MLVLLPPSEGKTAPADGPPLHLDAMSSPALNPWREKVLDALAEVSARPDAASVLGVGPSLAAEVAGNMGLRAAATAPAARVYTGVLYAAAGLADLSGPAAARAAMSLRVVSALWGLVAPDDAIPAYRLSMGVDLPGVGPLARVWREPLAAELDSRGATELVVDCRSAAYLAAWRPAAAQEWVAVRVLRELDGKRSVVSHHAKHTRGVLARHLLTRAAPEPVDAEQLAAAAGELVGSELHDVELGPAGRGARVLSLVVR
ncbi:YaaA family protein [Cellulomonas chengniuliangii]|uniref:YaaA family protein n=1 Tax=Cellulomonas chengniuliangii TaxID=2968084 RepID=UPI001D0F44A6|nr:peroxide stress protein YaaA [Cellulomonas chengniuliangii]MCC2318308.1 peroxide stress protein YaaA [Cellulomonas chengniuliangii]